MTDQAHDRNQPPLQRASVGLGFKPAHELASYSCRTRMHVVRLLAPRLDNETHIKDIDFSPAGICARWEAGYASTAKALEAQTWLENCYPLEGVILHEPRLAAVVWLDVFWVRIPEELHHGDIAGALRKRSWLNTFVAAGAAGAVTMLLFWVSVCTNGAF